MDRYHQAENSALIFDRRDKDHTIVLLIGLHFQTAMAINEDHWLLRLRGKNEKCVLPDRNHHDDDQLGGGKMVIRGIAILLRTLMMIVSQRSFYIFNVDRKRDAICP